MDRDSMQRIMAYYSPECGATIDSRQVKLGAVFFGLPGAQTNGAAYALQALKAGASCAVVDDSSLAGMAHIVVVDDVRAALQELAMAHRETLRIPIVAVTGTNGKTTTKNLLAAALAGQYHTHATSGNYNNDLGVPLTLLGITPQHQIAVLEMGANHPGEIRNLCLMARPTHGLITSIGEAHLEGFGSVEGVMLTKRELFDYLHATGGTAFVRTDDAKIASIAKEAHTGCSTSRYSLAEYDAHWDECAPGESRLHLVWQGQTLSCRMRLTGAYNAINAVAALHVAFYFNVPIEVSIRGIEAYQPDNHRSQVLVSGTNRVILDCYNANPSSMAEAIASFAAMPLTRPRCMILGGMRELGTESRRLHEKLATLAGEAQETRCLFVGEEWEGLVPEASYLPDAQAALDHLRLHPVVGHDVLVKGSRGIGLELLVSVL